MVSFLVDCGVEFASCCKLPKGTRSFDLTHRIQRCSDSSYYPTGSYRSFFCPWAPKNKLFAQQGSSRILLNRWARPPMLGRFRQWVCTWPICLTKATLPHPLASRWFLPRHRVKNEHASIYILLSYCVEHLCRYLRL
jgi:hypothetical protein